MREVDFLVHFQAVPSADRSGGGRPFPHTVHRQHDGLVVGRREESARRVTQMVFAEQQILVPAVMTVELRQLLP